MRPGRFTIYDLRFTRVAWFLALTLLAVRIPAQSATATNQPPTDPIGIEGNVAFDLQRSDYRPRPLDDRTEFILRIESIKTDAKGSFRYDFHYMGLEPGTYELADYLVRPDGSRPEELTGMQVHVQALLPEDHNGQLTSYQPERFPFIGGYRAALGAVGALWVGGLVAFAWSYRRRRAPVEQVAIMPQPSFAERLRPLVEAAAAGQLTTEQKAQIERLLMGFWRDKLQLPEMRMADVIARLRDHGEAGELLRALERWLHQRHGASATEIETLLEPYRQPAPQTQRL